MKRPSKAAALFVFFLSIFLISHDTRSETDVLDFLPAITASANRPTANYQFLTTPRGDAVAITLRGEDPLEGTLTFEVVSDPPNGDLTGTPPNLTYSPDTEFTGKDSFSFTATNQSGTSKPAYIDIYVIDPANFLHNLMVDFGPYDSQTEHAGDFYFRINYDKVFLEFGQDVLEDHQGQLKDNPAFEYLVDIDADVVSPVNATVFRLIEQVDTQDYEIHLVPVDINDVWLSIDHVKNPTVQENDQVTAGQVLGNPGTWDSYVGRVEIQIILTREGKSVCPFLFFNPATRAAYENKVNQLIDDWEAYKGNSEIYSEEEFPFTGCRNTTTGM